MWKKCPPKESVEGDDTVLRGSVRDFPRQTRGKFRGSPHTAPKHSVGTGGTLLRGQFSHTAQEFSTVAQTTKIMRFTGE